ncbi:hypothetical protein BH09BAC2_BH09BAC2_21570 [soil metagenome]
MAKFKSISTAVIALFLISCHTTYQTTGAQYHQYKINTQIPKDSALNAMLQPYADSVNRSMNDVVAVAAVNLEKKQPEGTLGNLMADIMLIKGKEKYNRAVDVSVLNYGGIRLPMIPAGEITRGKIFELSPFDNIIVLQVIDGKIIKSLLDHIASSSGGWPISGMSFQIQNKKAENIKIGGVPLDLNKKYTMALLDYVANGGDNAAMLRGIPQINGGFLFRDAILEYMREQKAAGKMITAKIENRITNAQ